MKGLSPVCWLVSGLELPQKEEDEEKKHKRPVYYDKKKKKQQQKTDGNILFIS